MLCQRCERHDRTGADLPSPCDHRSRVSTCERCGAAILTVAGVPIGNGDATLRQLAGFGLAATGQPLLEAKRKGT
jgi:hypothetical protein